MPSPTPDPGNVAAELMTKIDRWLVRRYLRGSRPELKLNAVTAAPMAMLAAQSRRAGIHRERAVMVRRGACKGQLPYHTRRRRGWVLKDRSVPFHLHRGNGNDPPDLIRRLVTVHESMVTNVQIASSREVTSPMRRSIRPKQARDTDNRSFQDAYFAR